MDTLQLLGTAMGLGLAAGYRLYATVLAVGLAVRLDFLHLPAPMSQLEVLADTRILAVAGVACALEFVADKVAWFDSLWDGFHTFIRPIGAAVLGMSLVGENDHATKLLIALLCGGIAFSGHSSKAATRLMVNHSPEPFSNAALSAFEDLLTPVALWVTFAHPLVALGIVLVFLTLFLWLSPKIFRLLNVQRLAIAALFRRWFGGVRSEFANDGLGPLHPLQDAVQLLPPDVKEQAGGTAGFRCAGTRSVGLQGSVGYLCVLPDRLVFIARRHFRTRRHEVPFDAIEDVQIRRGMLVDKLILRVKGREQVFSVFKAPRIDTRRVRRPLPA